MANIANNQVHLVLFAANGRVQRARPELGVGRQLERRLVRVTMNVSSVCGEMRVCTYAADSKEHAFQVTVLSRCHRKQTCRAIEHGTRGSGVVIEGIGGEHE